MFYFLSLFNAGSFLVYAIACLTSDRMVTEFQRYGLPHVRKLTGTLQILAVLGLIIGFKVPLIGAAASAGLALQMLVAACIRLRIRDGVLRSSPAFLYLFLNAWLFTLYLNGHPTGR